MTGAKSIVRAQALARRAGVPSSARAALRGAVAPALATLIAGAGDIIASAFLPIRDEPDTGPLFDALARGGLRTALPATPARGEPLLFRAWRPGEPLVPGRFGTVEPPPDAPKIDPDLLFVPLAAYDAAGNRLGYGAGYYDGALARLRGAKRIAAVGFAFAAQEVDSVPTEPHDQRLDAVLTERGLQFFGPRPCAFCSSAT